MAIPIAQLLPSIEPSIWAMSMFRPILGATMYIMAVMRTVPTKPPRIARVGFDRISSLLVRIEVARRPSRAMSLPHVASHPPPTKAGEERDPAWGRALEIG